MDIVSISFDKKNIKNKVFLAGLPILFSSNEIDQADKDLLRYSPNKIEINKLLIYQNNIDQIDKIENLPINMGAILIKNDSDQVKLIFKEIHTESLMSVVPTTGKLNEKDVIFEGFFKELMFKLPKFNNEYNDKVLESLILEGRFEQLGIEKPDSQTRFSGLNGSFILDSSDLYFEFFSENASIFTTEKFPYSDLGVLAVDGKLGIKTPKIKQFLEGKKLKVPINIFKLNLSNSDLKIESKGLLNLDSFSSQSIEIQGEVVFKNPKKIPYYLPKKIGKKTRNWLERGIVSADSVVGSFFYEGPLRSFSGSSDTENTKLEANFFVQNLDLVFSSRWPRIEGINTVITFQNSNFKIINATGFLNETKLSSINGEISNIFSKLPKLLLNGNITGSLDSFIEVSNNSPLEKWLWGVTKTASGEGNTSLNLTLNLDLKKIKNSSFNGNLFFENTEISFAENFLPLKEARGKITFTNKLISKIYPLICVLIISIASS